MKPVPLVGTAEKLAGGSSDVGSLVLRLRTSGSPVGDNDAVLARSRSDVIQAYEAGHSKIVYIGPPYSEADRKVGTVLRLGDELSHLSDGDIIAFRNKSSHARVLFRLQSKHAWFLTTEQCNNYCLMCSQPPKRADDSWLLSELAEAIALLPPKLESLGFTGGEPLLLGDAFLDLLRLVKEKLPETFVHVLSNGRPFANQALARKWASIDNKRLSVGIPLYSAIGYMHDHVVQASGAFEETVLGIMRLKNLGQRVELRIVLHRLTTSRLVETCKWIARNLRFVDHVALMGLENTGFAVANDAELWIDPVDYMRDLAEAVKCLSFAGMKVSIFNLPLCLIDKSVRNLAVKSISEWKNDFPQICCSCAVKSECAGFFSSGRPRISRGIAPIGTE